VTVKAVDETVLCYVGLGSNLDEPDQQVLAAMDQLDAGAHCQVVKCSSLYCSAPMGDQQQPDFVNAVCCIHTQLGPHAVLDHLLDIERDHQRIRHVDRPDGPRSLDLDLLLYGDSHIVEPGLTVPHPRMHLRRFVLLPLSEIAPELYIPGRGLVYELLNQDQIKRQRVSRIPVEG
jgi:2-amino-4-hydroxy-6-hydroxymethyldihydropteridine diphosphokinase